MTRLAFILVVPIVVASLFGADNPWVKVQQLPGRSELRIYKKGAREPLTAVLADAEEDRIVVVEKKQQLTIFKEDIDRIDARPVAPAQKPTVTTTQKTTEPDYTPSPNAPPAVPGTSSSSGVSFGSKPDFKTVYLRPPVAPKN